MKSLLYSAQLTGLQTRQRILKCGFTFLNLTTMQLYAGCIRAFLHVKEVTPDWLQSEFLVCTLWHWLDCVQWSSNKFLLYKKTQNSLCHYGHTFQVKIKNLSSPKSCFNLTTFEIIQKILFGRVRKSTICVVQLLKMGNYLFRSVVHVYLISFMFIKVKYVIIARTATCATEIPTVVHGHTFQAMKKP